MRRPVGRLRGEQFDKITIGDQLDALWKIVGALPTEIRDALPGDALAVERRVNDVKRKLPKR